MDLINADIKEIAKKLVAASNKKITHSEALDIIARMNGFNRFDKNCRLTTNYPKEIEKLLNKDIEKLAPEWEKIKNIDLNLLIPYIDYNNEKTNDFRDYKFHLFWLIERYFLFNDGCEINLENGIEKKLLNLISDDLWDENSDDIFEELRKEGVIQNCSPNQNLIFYCIVKKNPKKFIQWLRDCFNLKFNINKAFENIDNFEKDFIESDFEIKKSDMVYIPSLLTENTSFIPELSIETNYYLAEYDVLVKSKNIKVRLSYSFCSENYNKFIESEKLALEKYCKETEEDFVFEDYFIGEILEPSENDELSNFLYDETFSENAFAKDLVGIQFCKADEEFKYSLLDYTKVENMDLSFFEFREDSGMIIDSDFFAFNPNYLFDFLTINPDIKDILKDDNLYRFEIIKSYMNNTDFQELEDFYRREDSNSLNHISDINLSLFRYVFETIKEGLTYVLNEKQKELFVEFFKRKFEKAERIIEEEHNITLYEAKVLVKDNKEVEENVEHLKVYLFAIDYLNVYMYITDKNKNIETIQKLELSKDYFEELEGYDETPIEYEDERLIATFVPIYAFGKDAKDISFINDGICIVGEEEIYLESFKTIIKTLESEEFNAIAKEDEENVE